MTCSLASTPRRPLADVRMMFHQWAMPNRSTDLRSKALLALEEVVQEARWRAPRRSFAVRFALAFLWSLGGGEREPFVDFWKALARDDMWRFSTADEALGRIYRTLGLARDGEVAMRMWQARFEEEEG